MEGIDQLFGDRVGVSDIDKMEGDHQGDERTFQEVQLLYPRFSFLHLDNHAGKGMKLTGNGKGCV